MCEFISVMEKLKSSSSSSVANEEFTSFNNFMHTTSKMDSRLTEVVRKAAIYNKALVLVCGNSGDGKSHLIARLKESGVITDGFSVYIDATSADKKGMKANDKLKEMLMPLSDAKLNDGVTFRLIVAINLGILNDFLKNYEVEFMALKAYVEQQGLFDNVPAWKFEKMKEEVAEASNYFIGHVDFTSFHRYEISATGLDLDFIHGLLGKIVSDDQRNEIYASYKSECQNCPKRTNCPVYWNYRKLTQDETYREYIVEILAETIIKNNIAPSVRDINNFFYEIIIGSTFEETLINDSSTARLVHFIDNLSLNLLFEGSEGLLAYVGKQDALNNRERGYDKELITLNLKPSFEKWLREVAQKYGNELEQVDTDLVYCQNSFAKEYKSIEREIKRTLFKYYIRLMDSHGRKHDERYLKFLTYLFAYNVGEEQKCKDLIALIKDSIYVWNGRLGDNGGNTVKNAVICGKGNERYYLYKVIDVQFQVDRSIQPITQEGSFPNFATALRFGFSLKEKPAKKIFLDVDYELFDLLSEISGGYTPTDTDRKQNVNFDSFVRMLLAESDSDIHVYSRYEDGKTYRIAKDEFGTYSFENEG